MKKKVLALVLSLAMVFTMLPVTSVKADEGTPSEETFVSAGDGCVDNLARSATASAAGQNSWWNDETQGTKQSVKINDGNLATADGNTSWNSYNHKENKYEYPIEVKLTWEEPQTMASMRVMWWADGNTETAGVPWPSTAEVYYKKDNAWERISAVGIEHGGKDQGAWGQNNVWNVVNFPNSITTTELRMLVGRMGTDPAGVGISEWEVFSGKLKESIREVNISGEQLLAVGKAATYTGIVLPQTLADKATYTWSVPEESKTLIQIDGAANGKTVSVKALAEGEATLHLATVLDGGEPKEADFKITTKSEDEKDKETLRASIPEETTADFALPAQTASGKVITWESNDPLITVENNTAKIGTADVDTDVILTAKVNGSVFDTFTVKVKALIDLATITIPNYPYETEYNGLDQWPNGVGEVTVNGVTLRENTHYTCSGTFQTAGPKNVGEKTVVLTAKEGNGLCKGSKTVTYTITPKALTNENITLEQEEYNYTEGMTAEPAVTVKDIIKKWVEIEGEWKEVEETLTLVKDTDYTVAYSDNNAPGNGKVIIEGKGNYKGEITKTFSIIEEGKTNIKDAVVTLEGEAYLESGEAIEPDVTSVVLGGTPLTKDTDYTVSYINNTVPGTATVVITGKGEHYTGGVEKTFTIQKDLAKAEITLTNGGVYPYTGEAIHPVIQVVRYNGQDLAHEVDWKAVMPTEDVINPGTYEIGITAEGATGNLCGGTKKVSFKVVKELTAADVTVNGTYKETGAQIVPDVTVKVTIKENGQDVEKTLVKNTDYTVTCGENINAGEEAGTVTITGIGNYTGTVTKKFTIEEDPEIESKIDLNRVTVSFPNNGEYEYTGAEIQPMATVKDGETGLSYESDYMPEYPTDMVGVGDKTVTIKPGNNGKYKGSKTAVYKIKARNLTAANTEITLNIPENIEIGTQVKPEVSVKATVSNYANEWYGEEDGGPATISHDLVKDTDYTVEYGANNTAGTDAGSVTITGKGNYAGTLEKKFDINGSGSGETKKDLADAVVTIPDCIYNKSAQTPVVTVKVGDETLVKDTDYTVAYENNTNAGTAKAIITAKEDSKYTGTVEKTFTIGKANAVIIANNITKTIGDKNFAFGATVDSGAALSYQSANTNVIKVVNGQAQIVGTGNANITIKAAATPNYNEASKVITVKVNKPKTATLSKVKSKKSGQLQVTWKKDAKATGYKLMYSTDKKFKNKKATKTITIKKNKTVSKTIKKLKKGKKYYVKVCAYVKVGKKEVLGKYSKVKSTKIKK